MIRYRCEHCGARLESPAAPAGEQGKCPACGGALSVSAGTPRPFLKGLALGAVLGAAIGGSAAACIFLIGTSPRQARAPTARRQGGTDWAADGTSLAATTSAPTESIEKLTGDDVMAFARRHRMTALGGWRLDEDHKKVWDGPFRTWQRDDGLFVHGVWFPNPNRRIKEVFISRTGMDHGPEGLAVVLRAWGELCPDMVPRFRGLFDDMQGRPVLGAPLRWVGASPYAFGIAANNKAFVQYIGPQSEIPKRRLAAIAAANVRISWYRYILASARKLAPKLKPPATARQVSEEMSKAMRDLEHHFQESMVLFSCRSGQFVDYTARRQVDTEPLWPTWVPDDLPSATRIMLHRTAGEIATIARLARFVRRRGKVPAFKPYDHMVMAFSEHSGIERSAWGEYAKVEGLHETWKQLPPEQRKAVEEISLRGLASLRAALGED